MALIIPGSWVRVPPAPQQETAGQTPAPEYCLALGEPVRLLANPGSWGVWSDHESMPSLDELEARLAVFRTDIDVEGAALHAVGEVRDRATVFLDGDGVGVLDRERQDRAIMLPRGRGRLEIVVEEQDRVNYGSRIGEPKGLVGPASWARSFCRTGRPARSTWTAYLGNPVARMIPASAPPPGGPPSSRTNARTTSSTPRTGAKAWPGSSTSAWDAIGAEAPNRRSSCPAQSCVPATTNSS
jgi:hypothetical protein